MKKGFNGLITTENIKSTNMYLLNLSGAIFS